MLQGDVGSGKTLVALAAMLHAVESGVQAALLAPTEVLARQHHATINDACWRRSEWKRICCWDRGAAGAARKPVLDALADGSAKIVIGTHALISESVTYQSWPCRRRRAAPVRRAPASGCLGRKASASMSS